MSDVDVTQGFRVEMRPYSVDRTLTRAWLIDAQGVERHATPAEVALWRALAAAAARIVELEAQADEHHEARRKGRK